MLILRRALPAALAAALAGLACAAPAAEAAPAMGAAPAAPAASAYSAPSGSWDQFTSELSSASGVATGKGVTIAVLNTGADTSAKWLSGKVTEGPSYVGKESGSFLHTQGMMAETLILGSGAVLQGAAPDAKILDIRALPTDAKKLDSKNFDATEGPALAKAITYAADHGASVIEADAGVASDDAPKSLVTAVSNAIARGVVIVSPSFSDGQDSSGVEYPESAPGVIGVSSVLLPGGQDPSQLGGPGSPNESARDDSVAIAGPGDWVQALPDGWGPYGPGTSTPYVTATAALIKQRYPKLSPALVERAIAMSAQDKPSGGYSTQVGFGVIDPYDAVLDAATLAKVTVSAAPGPGVAAAGTHFGTGPLPGPVYALPSALWQVILSCAGIVAGAALLAFAALTVRKRRKARKDAEPGAGPGAGPEAGDETPEPGPGPEAAPA